MHELLFTFDVEDFINERSFKALHRITELLGKYRIRALFFITGHAAEKLAFYPAVRRSLEIHEIGFHSSAHSVHPTVFEYCDVKDYENAYSTSLERETSHIDPVSGEMEGVGGVQALRSLFSSKKVFAYKAPGLCCPPPHLEAMVNLGLKFDFSMNTFARTAVTFKGTVLYPCPIFLDCENNLLAGQPKLSSWALLLRSVLMRRISVLNFHPSCFVNKDYWDTIYHNGNPPELTGVSSRESSQTREMLLNLERVLLFACQLHDLNLVDPSPDFRIPEVTLDKDRIDLVRVEKALAHWPRAFFAYKPKYLYSQLSTFFDLAD